MRKLILLIALITTLISLAPGESVQAFHIDVKMDSYARCFNTVIDSGDLLCVGKFEIVYDDCNSDTQTGCPDESVTTNFIGHFIDTDGTGQLRSVRPYTLQTQCCTGYLEGIFSLYFTASDLTSLGIVTGNMTDYFLSIQGDPAVLASGEADTMNVEGLFASSLLNQSLVNRAQELETSWKQDLLDTEAGTNRFNADGEDYFSNAIPNLRQISPKLFLNVTVAPTVDEKTHDTSYDDDLRGFLQTSPTTKTWDDSITSFGTQIGVSGMVIKTLFSVIAAAGVAGFVFHITKNVSMGLVTVPLSLSILALMGIGTMGTIALLTFAAVIGLFWVLFLKGA